MAIRKLTITHVTHIISHLDSADLEAALPMRVLRPTFLFIHQMFKRPEWHCYLREASGSFYRLLSNPFNLSNYPSSVAQSCIINEHRACSCI